MQIDHRRRLAYRPKSETVNLSKEFRMILRDIHESSEVTPILIDVEDCFDAENECIVMPFTNDFLFSLDVFSFIHL